MKFIAYFDNDNKFTANIFTVPAKINLNKIFIYLQTILNKENLKLINLNVNKSFKVGDFFKYKEFGYYYRDKEEILSYNNFFIYNDILEINEDIFNELKKLWNLPKSYNEYKNEIIVKNILL